MGRRLLVGLIVLGLWVGTAQADTIYSFEPAINLNAATNTTNTTASPFLGWEICSSADGNPDTYCGVFGDGTMSFTVTPLAGYTLDVTGFAFDERNWTSIGPTAYAVYTSVDGFASPILSGVLAPEASSYSHHATSLSFLGLSAFEARIVTTGEPTGGWIGVWAVDNVTLSADTATTVPEPASLLLLGTGLAGLVRVARRRRQ
jgi:hypothetical protein